MTMTNGQPGETPSILIRGISSMSAYKISLIVVIVFSILSTIFNIAGPKILAKATTALATGWIAKLRGIGSIDFGYIGKILLILLTMYLCSAAFSFIQGWLMTGLSQKVCYDFRRQISEKINRLPLAYFEKRTVGEVLSRITNDVDTLGQSLNQSVTQLITSVTTMIGVLLMMLSISPRMTLIALLILPVSLVLVLLVVKFSQKYFKAQQATLGVVNGQVEEVYSGHNVIKAFNREASVLADFNTANDKLHSKEVEQDEQMKKDRNTKEVEAESVAYIVCQHFGIDTSDYSFEYIAGWSSGRDTKELRASMDTIRRTASELITGIEEQLQELQRNREVSQEQTKESILLIQNTDLSEFSLLDVYGMDRPELMQALSEMTNDDKLSIQAYLESRGAWTTEIGNQDSREYGEYHLDVRYNTDTDELIDMKERKAVFPIV